MALGKTYFIEKYINCTNEELNKSLNELNEFLNSEQLKKMREEEIKEGIDDTNCIENVKAEIDAIKEIIAEKSGDIDSIIRYVIGNNDPFWNIPVKVIVSKIINMNDGDKTSIRELVEENYSESQLKDIYLCVNRVCRKLDIVLDFSRENAKVDGLLYNLPFVIRKNKKSELYEIQDLEEITEDFLMKRGAFLYRNYKIKYNPDRDTGVTELKIRDNTLNKDIVWEFGEETFGTENCYKELRLIIIKHLNKENNSKKYLTREELAKKFYGYHSMNNINSKNEVLSYLHMITNYLNNYKFEDNDNFVMCGRKKIVYDEIINILNGTQNEKNPLFFVLGSLEEFMSNDNFINLSETNFDLVNSKNFDYIKNGCICLEEKKYIENIIKAIENYISDNDDSKQSLDDLIRNISPDPFWQTTIKKYFDALNINDAEKIDFLINVSANKSLFNEFTKDINNFTDSTSIYKKYYELVNSKNDNVNNNEDFLNNYNYYKKKETDVIWWVGKTDNIGEHLFTFDKKKIYNLFKDYPYKLTKNEKEIFDKENPYWTDFFKDRNNF